MSANPVFKARPGTMADNLATTEDESHDFWYVDGNVMGRRFDNEDEAAALAERLNAALEEPDFSLEQARNG